MTGAVVYATEQGLGRQAKDFYDNGIIDTVLVWKHSSYTNHYEWYPNRVSSFDELLDKCDKIIFLETPYDWSFILKARERGVKTILFIMYECTRFPLPYFPDVLVGGSILEREFFGDDVKVINVPVPKALKWKQRTRAKVFIHNAGHGGLAGRNGTAELIKAIPLVKSDCKFIIRSQFPLSIPYNDPRLTVIIGDQPYETLFSEGDVFVYPDKFGGSCLPLQEAHASGMAVMASSRHPTNTWLPIEILIPIKGYKKDRAYSVIDSAIVDPVDIANKIDEWYDKDITHLSLVGKKWGEDNSWDKLKPQYENL